MDVLGGGMSDVDRAVQYCGVSAMQVPGKKNVDEEKNVVNIDKKNTVEKKKKHGQC